MSHFEVALIVAAPLCVGLGFIAGGLYAASRNSPRRILEGAKSPQAWRGRGHRFTRRGL